jgi:hypothetical protein
MPRIKSRMIARHYATPHSYDVVVYTENGHYYAKNAYGDVICVDSQTACIQEAVNYIASTKDSFGGRGGKIYISRGIYDLNNNPVNINNLSDVIIEGNKPAIHNTVITLYGDRTYFNMNNVIRNILFRNSTIVIQNGIRNLFENLAFHFGQTFIKLQNTIEWTEGNWFRNIDMLNPSDAAFVFDTPTGTGTNSYDSNRLDNVFIDLYTPGSKGIVIGEGAHPINVRMSNIRIWVHSDNIVGLYINSYPDHMQIYNIVFESFVEPPTTSLYGIYIDQKATYVPIIVKPIFIGHWTQNIYNPYNKWFIGNVMGKRVVNVPVGTNNTYGQAVIVEEYEKFYVTIPTPRLKITWSGQFAPGEVVTVKITFNYIDGSQTSITKSATMPNSYWLTYDDLFNLYPGNNILQSITAQAMSSATSTQVTVTIDALFS